MLKSLTLLILLLPAASFASGYLTPLGSGVEVSHIHVHSGGGFTMWVNSNDIQNPDVCARTDKVHVKPTLAGYDGLLSLALAAYTSGHKIGMWSTGCEIIPFWGGTKKFPAANNLWIARP